MSKEKFLALAADRIRAAQPKVSPENMAAILKEIVDFEEARPGLPAWDQPERVLADLADVAVRWTKRAYSGLFEPPAPTAEEVFEHLTIGTAFSALAKIELWRRVQEMSEAERIGAMAGLGAAPPPATPPANAAPPSMDIDARVDRMAAELSRNPATLTAKDRRRFKEAIMAEDKHAERRAGTAALRPPVDGGAKLTPIQKIQRAREAQGMPGRRRERT